MNNWIDLEWDAAQAYDSFALSEDPENKLGAFIKDQIPSIYFNGLDIGAGTLVRTSRLMGIADHWIALDPCCSFLNYGNLKRNWTELDSIVGKAEAIPLTDRSVDLVVSSWTVAAIEDIHRGLSEICRVLDEGSVVIIENMCYGSFAMMRNKFSNNRWSENQKRRLSYISCFFQSRMFTQIHKIEIECKAKNSERMYNIILPIFGEVMADYVVNHFEDKFFIPTWILIAHSVR